MSYSDFDPALVFSDFPPSDDYDQHQQLPTPKDTEIENIPVSDDLEAIDLVCQEAKERFDRAGVVIRHRIQDGRVLFRSSSFGPDNTPTKIRTSCRDASLTFFETPPPTSSPTLPSPPTKGKKKKKEQKKKKKVAMDSSMLSYPRSSPPPSTMVPAQKRQKTFDDHKEDEEDDPGFAYPDSDEDEAAKGEGSRAPEEEEEEGGGGKEDGDKTPTQKPFIPKFNIALGGGLFSKKFTPSSKTTTAPSFLSSRPASTVSTKPSFRRSLTPPPRIPSPDHHHHRHTPVARRSQSPPILKPVHLQSPSVSTERLASSSSSSSSACTYLPVLTSSGKIIQIRQNPPRTTSTRSTNFHSAPTSADNSESGSGMTKSYYGVNIHALISDYNANKSIKQMQASSPCAAVVEPPLQPAGEKPPPEKCLLWTEKYRAKRFTDLIGDERTHRQVLRWLKTWDETVFPSLHKPSSSSKQQHQKLHENNNKLDEWGNTSEPRKILLIHGPPGLGKTTLAHVAAKQAGYEVVEVNASDDRNAGVVKGKIKDILSNEGVKCMGLTVGKKNTLAGKPVCLVVDEIDGVTGGGGGGGGGGNEGGFIKALIDLILADQKASQSSLGIGITRKKKKKTGDTFRLQRPIIAICNDLYAPSLKALRPLAEIVHMKKPPAGLMVNRLKWVFEKEGFSVEEGACRRLVELSSMGGGGSGSGSSGSKSGGGDMRGALVGGEWIASRLRNTDTSSSTTTLGKKGHPKKTLTRKMVEEEFGGGGFGENDGKGSGGRGGVREVVEKVFYIEKEASSSSSRRNTKPSSSSTTIPKTSCEKLRVLAEGCGEFDKIITDCFTTYPTRPFHDDAFLTKPNTAYEWLYFADLISHRVYAQQEYELAPYLCQPIIAFHTLFATSIQQPPPPPSTQFSSTSDPTAEQKEPTPFSGPTAEWESRQRTKENKALIQTIIQQQHSSTSTTTTTTLKNTIRLHQCFKSLESISTELAPWICRILTPKINPVIVGGSTAPPSSSAAAAAPGWGGGGSIASIRKESEKLLVTRAVQVMLQTGITFEKVRIENTTTTTSGWIYRMDPPLDTLTLYPTLSTTTTTTSSPPPPPVRFSIRQVLTQEYIKTLHHLRHLPLHPLLPHSHSHPAQPPPPTTTTTTTTTKRDFFGRPIPPPRRRRPSKEPWKARKKVCRQDCATTTTTDDDDGEEEEEEEEAEEEEREEMERERERKRCWISYREGFSNAVRKGIGLEEVMAVFR